MIQAIVIAACVIAAMIVCRRHQCKKIKSVVRKERVEIERRREAHYMRNFWNYDGSEQEEFEG